MDRSRSVHGGTRFARPAAVKMFVSALEYPATEWHTYLDTACGDDDALRKEVQGLLDAPPDATLVLQTRTLDEQTQHAARESEDTRDRSGTMLGHFRLEERLGAGGMG